MTSTVHEGTDMELATATATETEDLGQILYERRNLINVAYRMLGSLTDAEDVTQEAMARWYAMPSAHRQEINSPGAWLTTVTTRICLDLLGSARVRRERYVGEWLPEPLPDHGDASPSAADDPEARVTMDESVNMALLVVLDEMTPAERVVFVLHDIFSYPFPEVAEMVGRTPGACRQLASTARRRVRDARPKTTPTKHDERIVRRFKEALGAGDIDGLVALLADKVTATSDGGGRVKAALRPILGPERVSRAMLGIWAGLDQPLAIERTVNGRPGLIVQQGGQTITVCAFEIVEGRIQRLWAVRNPEKLRPWTTGAAA